MAIRLLIAGSVLLEERLDLPDEPRPEIRLGDFGLSREWQRLFAPFDVIQNGSIERLEVLAGIPRRESSGASSPRCAAIRSGICRAFGIS